MSGGILKMLTLHRFFLNLMTIISNDTDSEMCFHNTLPAGGKLKKAKVQKQRRWATVGTRSSWSAVIEGLLRAPTPPHPRPHKL